MHVNAIDNGLSVHNIIIGSQLNIKAQIWYQIFLLEVTINRDVGTII